MSDEDGHSFAFAREMEDIPAERASGTPPPPWLAKAVRRERIKREVEGWATFISGAILLLALSWATMPQPWP